MTNKNILLSLCLLLISIVGVGCVSAADTNTTDMSDLSQMTVDQQSPDINVVSEVNNDNVVSEKVNKTIAPENKKTADIETSKSSTDKSISTNQNNNKSKLNIKGPKINGSKLDIKGPKVSQDGPKLEPSKIEKGIMHYARVFKEDIDTYKVYTATMFKVIYSDDYTVEEAAEIAAQIYNRYYLKKEYKEYAEQYFYSKEDVLKRVQEERDNNGSYDAELTAIEMIKNPVTILLNPIGKLLQFLF